MSDKTRNIIISVLFILTIILNLFYVNASKKYSELATPEFFGIKLIVANKSGVDLEELEYGSFSAFDSKLKSEPRPLYKGDYNSLEYGKDVYYANFHSLKPEETIYLKYKFKDDKEAKYIDINISDLDDFAFPQARIIEIGKDRVFEQLK